MIRSKLFKNSESKKVIRKPDPSKRKNIFITTLKKIENFLEEQKEPVFKSEIVRQLGVNFNSLNVALEMLPIIIDEQGRIQLNKKGEKSV